MNNSLTLRQLVTCIESYLDQGHVNPAGSNAGSFAAIVRQSSQAGLDTVTFLRECLPTLQSLDRCIKRTRERWIGVFLRVAGVLVLVMMIRLALLSEVSESVFSAWIILDRLCGGCVIFIALIIGLSMRSYIDRFSWTPAQSARVWRWLSDYLVLRDTIDGPPQARERLRDIRIAEIMYGVDGYDARQRFYLRDLTRVVGDFEARCPQIAFISIAVEWLAYMSAAVGFIVVPFLAWIEGLAGVW